ncbi:MAG: hypothetical protein AB1656_13345 [Candidatus Omnitrophota bacterium]
MKKPLAFMASTALWLSLYSCLSDPTPIKTGEVPTRALNGGSKRPISQETKPAASDDAKSAIIFDATTAISPKEIPAIRNDSKLAAVVETKPTSLPAAKGADNRYSRSTVDRDSPLIVFNAIPKLDDEPAAKIKGDKLEELSGIAPAAQPGEYWGHNDRGNDAEIFRFDRKGEIQQKTVLTEWENDDWEAALRGDDGFLYIGGFGDNDKKRELRHLYKVKEPAPGAKKISGAASFAFTYSDEKAHNCEAFFSMMGRFYLITKTKKDDEKPIVFRLESLKEKETNIAQEVGRMEIRGEVTDAAYSKPHNLLAVLTYEEIFFFSAKEEKDLWNPPAHRIEIDYEQCEGLCFDKENLVLCNEPGNLWVYPLSRFLKTN